MITLTSAQLNAWIGLLIWPFARTLALIATAPVTGNAQFPVTAKIGLALMIAVLVAPTLPAGAGFDPAGASGLLLLARETLLGVGMGFAMRIVFTAIEAAGEVIGLQMGLGFAQFYDPLSSAQVSGTGQFLGLLATLVFLSLDGHLLLITTLAQSFQQVPAAPAAGGMLLAQWGGMVMQAAVLMSLPLIAALLITNAALAVLTRAAPQLNLFAIGFPITMLVGFVGLLVMLPHWVPTLERYFAAGFETALRYAGQAR